MVDSLRQEFKYVAGKYVGPTSLPDVSDDTRVRLSFSAALSIVAQNTDHIGIMERNHRYADARDQLLSSPDTLSVLSQNGFNKIFVEVEPDHLAPMMALKHGYVSAKQFAQTEKIWSWYNDNEQYVRDNFAPLVTKAAAQGVSVEPADMAGSIERAQFKAMSPAEQNEAMVEMGDKTLTRIFPEMNKDERQALWGTLYNTVSAGVDSHGAVIKNYQHKPLTDLQVEQIDRVIDSSYANGVERRRPDLDDVRSLGMERNEAFHDILGQIIYNETTINRAYSDSVTADYIQQQSQGGPVVVVMGANHFLHDGGLQDHLQPMVRVSLWGSRDEFVTSQLHFDQKVISEAIGYKQELGELVYFMKEKELYTTETTPPAIVQQLKQAEDFARNKTVSAPSAAPSSVMAGP
jgi:hypothetical protein